MFVIGRVEAFEVSKSAPRFEIICSSEMELSHCDVENMVVVVEYVDDGIDPIVWSLQSTLKVRPNYPFFVS